MRIILKCVVLALCLSAVRPTQLSRTAESSLMQFMLQSRSLQQYAGAERSLECFNYYVPLLNAIVEQFEIEYAACLAASEQGRNDVDTNSQPQRDAIEDSAKSSCEALQGCIGIVSSVDYFECFVDTASGSAKGLYTVSVDAADTLVEVREAYRLIENAEYRCTNDSERTYTENTAKTYKELDSCLQGKTPVPTEGPPTEEPPTDGPPTEEPPTEEPPTEEPPTEEPPTDGPETEGPPTEEPPTDGPETEGPPTEEPPTDGPETEGPSTEDPGSNESDLPEEDLSRISRNRLEKIMRELEENWRHSIQRNHN